MPVNAAELVGGIVYLSTRAKNMHRQHVTKLHHVGSRVEEYTREIDPTPKPSLSCMAENIALGPSQCILTAAFIIYSIC